MFFLSTKQFCAIFLYYVINIIIFKLYDCNVILFLFTVIFYPALDKSFKKIYNKSMKTLDEFLQEKSFYFKFNRFSNDFLLESIGYEDFHHVEEFSFFRKQPFYTLHYVLRGQGVLYFRGKTYNIRAGQYFVLPIQEDFKYVPDKEDPWKYFWFDFGGNAAQNFFQELYIDSPVLTNASEAESHSLFKNLFQEISENNSVKYYSAMSCFYGVLNCLSQNTTKPEKLSIIDDAKRFMELNFHSAEFSVDALCKLLHISHSYLCKIFKTQTGMTVKTYLTTLRIKEALRLLKGSNLNVKEIAFRVGFSDEVNFMKAFKKYRGVTPSEYRNS